MKIIALFLGFLSLCITAGAQQALKTIPLYDGPIPNAKVVPDEEKTDDRNGRPIVSKITRPTLSIFLPEGTSTPTAAVVICPGGGYWVNAIGHEGYDVARTFNEMGVAAFVVKYRIPNDAAMTNRETGPMQDVQQAIKHVRENASAYGIDPAKVGLMGFSAGGHLASTAGTHFDVRLVETTVSLRPDFLMLIYPVISFSDSVAHIGSRDQLIGKNPPKEKIDYYSNELRVNADTPPTFLVHASDDGAVKPANSVLFYTSLVNNKVPAELHIYQRGGHGFGMINPTTTDKWMERLRAWMVSNGWIK